jgi:hypothetical protein
MVGGADPERRQRRIHTAPRDSLITDGLDEPVVGQLPDGVVERVDIDVHVALDHRIAEAPLDLVGVNIPTVKDAEDE